MDHIKSAIADPLNEILSPELLKSVVVHRREPDNDLYRLFQQSSDVWKWHHYFDIYSAELERFRRHPIKMLEIGVYRGGSLGMWKEYLHPESVVVGIDIDTRCAQHETPDRKVFVRIGDQVDNAFLNEITREFGEFDLIIDDGGHTTTQMIASFNHLFPKSLAAGGIYIVEDTHTNYWARFVNSKTSFIDVCKALVDQMHSHYANMDGISRFGNDAECAVHTVEVPFIEAWLHRVSFYDSIIILEKRAAAVPVHQLRTP